MFDHPPPPIWFFLAQLFIGFPAGLFCGFVFAMKIRFFIRKKAFQRAVEEGRPSAFLRDRLLDVIRELGRAGEGGSMLASAAIANLLILAADLSLRRRASASDYAISTAQAWKRVSEDHEGCLIRHLEGVSREELVFEEEWAKLIVNEQRRRFPNIGEGDYVDEDDGLDVEEVIPS